MKAIARIVLTIAASLSLSACGKTIDWKQEVKLHDGRVIVVERQSKQNRIILPERQTIEVWQRLTFMRPGTSVRIEFELPKGLRVWLLDFEGDAAYAVLKPASVADYNTWGCPSPAWIAYRHRQGSWQQIVFTELPMMFKQPNIMPAAASNEAITKDGLVTTTEFETFLNRSDSSFQTISRGKVNPIAYGCHESVLHKQGRQSEIDNRR